MPFMTDESSQRMTVAPQPAEAETSELFAAPGKILSPEALRALQEAQARRQGAAPANLPPEVDGRDGEEPTRFGDWEKNGLAVDF